MATTINSYSVSLALDASNYVRNSSLSRNETAQLRRAIESARDPSERLSRSVNMLDKALQAGAIDIKTYTRLMQDAEAKTAKLEQTTNKLNGSMGGLSGATGSAGGAFVALAGRLAGPLAIIEGLRRSLSASFEVEKAKASLEVLMGSAAAAEQQLKDLRAIDAESPLSFEAGLQATRTLLSFGVAADDVTATLRMLGDVTGADNERFKSMALAFAQVSAAGRLQGQDLRQMIDAGFNPLQEISRQTGESLTQLKERMEAGGIASQEIADAFRSATGEGGKFNGMMDKLGQTASGKFGQAASQLQQAMVQIGDAFGPIVIQLSSMVSAAVRLLDAPLAALRTMGNGLAYLLAIVNDVTDSFAYAATGQAELAWQFEHTNKILNDLGATANSTGEALAGVGGAADTIASKTEAAASKFRQSMEEIKKQWATEANASQGAFQSQISGMQRQVEQATFGESKLAEIDAIRNIFDKADATQRVVAKHFEEMLASGKMMSDLALKSTLTEEQEIQLEQFRTLQKQTQEIERQKKLAEEMKRSEEARGKLAQDALKNAQAYFEEQRKYRQALRKDIANTGAGAGFEVGSAEAARFMADQENARLAGMVAIQGPPETDQAILDKASEQVQILTRQEEKTNRMLGILERHLEVAQQNGFKRIR